ncbi:hypothetical protein TRFO_21141 [Tritrichomonas foetus]|uniref:Myb-like DNA-binding domain containing protein n=1 Tax=Tritrichomonas foetus TaxID=1144522 RepID=A0A1J4KFT6_9EUKA|nr:hypothetical protein TRFO_21141 [Tritrichomonas foetus]|eukprot:OHT09792.1 hypothetical protein TRFO_21141 [Tritrichomonas foetus]
MFLQNPKSNHMQNNLQHPIQASLQCNVHQVIQNSISNGIQARPHRAHPKSKFTPEEDEILRTVVEECGQSDWVEIAKRMPNGRNARQCRDRWQNYLSPDVVNGPWTEDEEALLVQKYNEIGPYWKQIATFFPTRTDINIKSRWNLRERRLKKAEKNRLKQVKKQRDLEEKAKILALVTAKTTNVSQNSIVNSIISEQPTNQPIISVNPIQFSNESRVTIHPIIDMSNIQTELHENIQKVTTKIEENKSNQINCDPLPSFFGADDDENNKSGDEFENFNFELLSNEFDSSANECWNSLLMNEENSGSEGVFEGWF